MVARRKAEKNTQSTFLSKCAIPALLLLLAIQLGIMNLAFTEVTLPKFILNVVASCLSSNGISVEINSGKMDHLMHIELQGIRLYKAGDPAEHILEAQYAEANFKLRHILFHNGTASQVFVDRITMFCPATLSASGNRETTFRGGRITLRLEAEPVLYAQGKLGNSPVYFYANVFPTAITDERATETAPITESPPREVARTVPATTDGGANYFIPFAKISQILALLNTKQKEFGLDGKVTLHGVLSGTPAEPWIFMQALADEFALPQQGILLNQIRASQLIKYSTKLQTLEAGSPLRVFVESGSFRLGDRGITNAWQVFAEKIDVATILNRIDKDFTLPESFDLRTSAVTAENLRYGEFAVNGISARIYAKDITAEEISFSALANAETLGSAMRADVAFKKSSGVSIKYSAEVDTGKLFATAPLSGMLPADVKKLKFFDSTDIRGDISLSPESEFLRANYELNGGPAVWRMINAEAIRSHGLITPKELKIQLAQVRGETFCTNVRVETELNERGKYRIQAFGTIENPEALDDYLGWFWWRIWNNIKRAPSPTAPRADVDVYGTWDKNSKWEKVYGAIAGENGIGGGVLVDKVRLRVAEEPTFITAFDMGFERGGKLVSGMLQWHYSLEPEYHYRDFRFSFNGTMPPHDVFKIVGEGLPEAFSGILVRETAGTADVSGFFSGNEDFYPEIRQMVKVDVKSAPGDFEIFGIAGKNFSGKILYDSGDVLVGPFAADCGDGKVNGSVLINFPEKIQADGTRIKLKLDIKDVTRTQFTQALSVLKNAAQKSDEQASPQKAEIAPIDDNSRLNATFAGTITLPSIKTLEAKGTFNLKEPDLFDLQIFGNFSRLLEKINFSLTSFNMDTASADFTIKNGYLYLPNLDIYGESGELAVQANIRLADEEITGRAIFRNRRGNNWPILGPIVNFASDSTKFMPIDITGSLDNIRWEIHPFKGNDGLNPGAPPESQNP